MVKKNMELEELVRKNGKSSHFTLDRETEEELKVEETPQKFLNTKRALAASEVENYSKTGEKMKQKEEEELQLAMKLSLEQV